MLYWPSFLPCLKSPFPYMCLLTSNPTWTGIFVSALIRKEPKIKHPSWLHTHPVQCFFTVLSHSLWGHSHHTLFESFVDLFSFFILLFKVENCDLTPYLDPRNGWSIDSPYKYCWMSAKFFNSVVSMIYLGTSFGISSLIYSAQVFHYLHHHPSSGSYHFFCINYCNCFPPALLDSDFRSLYFTAHSKPQDNNHSENAPFTFSLLSIKYLVVPTRLLCSSNILLGASLVA